MSTTETPNWRHGYWAITGRFVGEGNSRDDTPFVATVGPVYWPDAQAEFEKFMVDEAMEHDEEEEIRKTAGLRPDQPLSDAVLIVSAFVSQTPIDHG